MSCLISGGPSFVSDCFFQLLFLRVPAFALPNVGPTEIIREQITARYNLKWMVTNLYGCGKPPMERSPGLR